MSLSYEFVRALVIVALVLGAACWFVSRHPTSGDSPGVPPCGVIDLDLAGDGKTMLSLSRHGTSTCGRLLLHGVTGPHGAVEVVTGDSSVIQAALLRNVNALISVGDEGWLQRITLDSGCRFPLQKFDRPYEISALGVAPDGQAVAIGIKGTLLVCDSLSGDELWRQDWHASYIGDVVFSDDGRLIASASDDGVICVWDRAQGACLRKMSRAMAPIVKLAFVEGNRRLVSVSSSPDAALRLWDIAEAELLWHQKADQNGLQALAVAPDGVTVATGGFDRVIGLWDLGRREQTGSLAGHTGRIRALQYSPDGRSLISAAEDGTIRFWDVAGHALVETVHVNHLRVDVP